MDTQTITLSREEVYAVESVLKNDDMDGERKIARPLLLKVGSALLEHQAKPAAPDVAISLTEPEVWLLRDRVPITMQVGHQPVGLSLKLKLYEILLAFDAARATGDLPIADHDDARPTDLAERLKRFEVYHAHRNSDEGAGEDPWPFTWPGAYS